MKQISIIKEKKKIIYICFYVYALFILPVIIRKYLGNRINAEKNVYINIVIYAFLFLIAICFFIEKLKKDCNEIFTYKDRLYRNLSLSLALGFLALFVQIVLAFAVSLIVPENTNQNISNQSLYTNLPATFILSVIFAPMVEEIVFKFIIFKSLLYKNKFWAYFVTCVLFGLLHCFNALLKGELNQMLLLVVYAVPVAIECYLYQKTENIYYNVFIHMLWNTISNMAHM
ncbi:MAG: lysostaphin resistance A-like protein [Lachnospira sp.]